MRDQKVNRPSPPGNWQPPTYLDRTLALLHARPPRPGELVHVTVRRGALGLRPYGAACSCSPTIELVRAEQAS